MRHATCLLLAAIVFMIASPARAQFCPGVSPWVFDDVAASDPFCGYITWMAQNGITLGCQVIDANHRLYCPNATVSRAAMAAFMNRLGNVRVEAVDTGPGLTGGPITSVGTINLATTQLLPTTACATNQIPKWNGTAWTCSADANSGGTVTSVGSGTGLAGGPITSTGTLSIAAGYQLPQGCTNGQIAKSNGAGSWTCASDVTGTGTVTSITAGAGLTGGTITTSGTIAVDPASAALTSNFFRQGGNAFGATAVLGTSDNNPVELKVNGTRIMRYEPGVQSPNLLGGHPANSVGGFSGQTIAGGGRAGLCFDPATGTGTRPCANRADAAFATVAGGWSNLVSASDAFVGGGFINSATASSAFIGGGGLNVASGPGSVIGGGGLDGGVAMGNRSAGISSTVGGGVSNDALGDYSTVGGGNDNDATGGSSTVGGGATNRATGLTSTVPGGWYNSAAGNHSFAAGRRAKANSIGTFAWADGNDFDFVAYVPHEFAVRATGGARFVTAIDGAGGATKAFAFGIDGRVTVPATVALEANDAPLVTRGWDLFGITAPATKVGLGRWGLFMEPNRLVAGVPNVAGREFEVAKYNVDGTRLTLLRVDQAGNLYTAGAINPPSDVAAKTGFAPVAAQEVLERVVTLPIASWSYRSSPEVRHVGPTAQDFRAAFGLGENDKTIATVDADGVALAAIQGLNAKVEAQAREIVAQRSEIEGLRRALEVLLARTSPEGRTASR